MHRSKLPPSCSLLRLSWESLARNRDVSVLIVTSDVPSVQDEVYIVCSTSPRGAQWPLSDASLVTNGAAHFVHHPKLADMDDWEQERVDEHFPHANYDIAIWEVVGDGGGHCCCYEDHPSMRPIWFVVGSLSKQYVTIRDFVLEIRAWDAAISSR